MSDQGVTAVRRIHVRREGSLKPTNTFVLSFNTPVLPKEVNVGFLKVPVDVYVPNPLRCYRCQMFGHHEDRCGRAKVCVSCGEPDHVKDMASGKCDKPAKCCSCSGNHPANSRDCTAWVKEKRIMKIKYEQNISFQEARKQIEDESSTSVSYASVAKKQTVDKSTQTEEKGTQTEETKDKQENINIKGLKPQAIEMMKREMERAKQKEKLRAERRDRADLDGKVTKASESTHTINKNPYAVLEHMEADDSVIFSESAPGVPKGTLQRLSPT